MKVVILHDEIRPGAREDELDALVQAEAIGTALGGLGHESESMGLTLDLGAGRDRLKRLAPDLVFNIVESVGGCARLIHLSPALLDAIGIPYTGGSTEAMFLTSSKLLTKEGLLRLGYPTASWMDEEGIAHGEFRLPDRFIIKSSWEEASVGIEDDNVMNVSSVDELRSAMRRLSGRLGGCAFAERFIEGREFNLSVLAGPNGPEALPPAEIHFTDYPPGKPRIVNFAAKWRTDAFEYHHTPRCFDFAPADRPLLERLRRLSLDCWSLFRLRGYARVDFRVDSTGQPWILEVNVNPCISPDAGFTAAAQQAGLSYADMIQRIVADAPVRWGDGSRTASPVLGA